MEHVEKYLVYPAVFEKNPDNSYTVSIRGMKGAITEGNSYAEAVHMAKVVISDMAQYLAGKEQIPAPAKPEEGDVMIDVGYDVALKIVLRNLMLAEKWRISDIAKKLGYSRQRVAQNVNFDYAAKIETLAKIFKAIGRPLTISC